MEQIKDRFKQLGLILSEILLPHAGINPEKWAVIACDQYTQDREYWEKVKSSVKGEPSTMHLIYPEVFLHDENREQKIKDIHRQMEEFLAKGVFAEARTGCVYVERNTLHNANRRGLVIAVDLEHYDWRPGAQRLIRCTEGTVAERLPLRMDIRRNASLETSHVLLLIDDEQDRLLPTLAERVKSAAPAYSGRLMTGSGDISGWFVDSTDDWDFIAAELEGLAKRALTCYSSAGTEKVTANAGSANAEEPFLFAVGDGNHSLATAKEIWEEYKRNHPAENLPGSNPGDGLPIHPCRYALVEIENIYDPAIKFEPIHRVMFGMPAAEAIELLSRLPGFSSRRVSGRGELTQLVKEQTGKNRLGLIANGTTGSAAGGKEITCTLIESSASGLITAYLQPLLDSWLETQAGTDSSIDYIHGEDELFRLAAAPQGAVGLLLPPINKSGFFETIARGGPLPRKSFSMGEADEKRFYLECRKIID